MKSNTYNTSWLFLVFSLVLPVSLYADYNSYSTLSGISAPQPHALKKKLVLQDLKKTVFLDKDNFIVDFYDDVEGAIATVRMSLYNVTNKTEQRKVADQYGPVFRNLFQTIRPFVYLSYFKIFNDKFKNQGLGKQLFEYGLYEAKKMFPKAMYFWTAVPLDGPHKKSALLRFYKNRGGIMLKDLGYGAAFYIDLAQRPQIRFPRSA